MIASKVKKNEDATLLQKNLFWQAQHRPTEAKKGVKIRNFHEKRHFCKIITAVTHERLPHPLKRVGLRSKEIA